MKNWYSICALTDGAEISIYDEIGAYGVSAKAFLADLGILEFLPKSRHYHLASTALLS